MSSTLSYADETELDPANLDPFINPKDVHFGVPDAFLQELTRDTSTIPSLDDASWNDWPIPGTTSQTNGGDALQSELPGPGMASNDFNPYSVDLMSDLLNLDPMVFSNDIMDSLCSTVPDFSVPVSPSMFSFNSVHPTNLTNPPFALPPVFTPSPVIECTEAQPIFSQSSYGQEVSPAESSNQAAGLSGREDVSIVATPSETDSTPQFAQLSIQPVHDPVSTTARDSSVPSSSACAGPSPASSAPYTNTGTKLAHSAVERRYRANMREYIKNLREVVPALRVLELKSGNRISNLSLKPEIRRVGIDADAVPEGADVIDERGFIDGVKVAHNGSKTTTVLKATEYIRVLKRRELRLKREQEGLKELVRSFPAGTERLQQWEVTWMEKYGGPEKDEVDEDQARRNNQSSGDGDDGNSSADESFTLGRENGKRAETESSTFPSKRRKTNSAQGFAKRTCAPAVKKYIPILPAYTEPSSSNALTTFTPIQPEKRKRGRPRKAIVLPPVPTLNNNLVQEALIAQQQRTTTTVPETRVDNAKSESSFATYKSLTEPRPESPQSGRYLLAVFAFLSFLNVPFPLSSRSFDANKHGLHAHTYTGAVVAETSLGLRTPGQSNSIMLEVTLSWRDATRFVHLAVSVYLVFYFMRPRLHRIGRFIARYLYFSLSGLSTDARPHSNTSTVESSLPKKYEDLGRKIREGAKKLRDVGYGELLLSEIEEQEFRDGLGLRTGITGLLLTLPRLLLRPERHDFWTLERRTYFRVAEITALNVNAPVSARLQMFICAFRFNYGCSFSATEIATLALVIHPVWHRRSVALWEFARNRVRGRGSYSAHIYKLYDSFVLETMSIDEAIQRIARLDRYAGARFIAANAQVCGVMMKRHREFASPLPLLARQVVLDYIRGGAERLFLKTVSEDRDAGASDENDDKAPDHEQVLAAGRSLDPLTVALVNLYDQVCHSNSMHSNTELDTEDEANIQKECGILPAMHSELHVLLEAIVSYRRVFLDRSSGSDRVTDSTCSQAGEISKSAPSEGNEAECLSLKRCLESPVFDGGCDDLKDARNRVRNMLKASECHRLPCNS